MSHSSLCSVAIPQCWCVVAYKMTPQREDHSSVFSDGPPRRQGEGPE